jgi:vitamin B12 transporter
VFTGSGVAAVVPKIGFLQQAADFLSIKYNYFCNFKIPDFEDLYWVGGGMYGNPDLRPEDGWGTDLGLVYTWQDRVTVEGVSFYQYTSDSIHWYSSGGTWKPTNVGKAIFFGADLKLRFVFPLPQGFLEKIGISLSYQYLLSYLLSYGYDYASNKRIPYMPLHTAGFSVDIPWKIGARKQKGSLVFSGHYEGLRYADVSNLTKLKPYLLLNLNINQEINKHLSCFIVLRNILNQSYESFNEYYMPGLTITLGVQMNLDREP